MRIESKLEDLYINDLIKVHKYLIARSNELMTPYGVNEEKKDLRQEFHHEIQYLEEVIFSEYKNLSKNSRLYRSTEPQEIHIP